MIQIRNVPDALHRKLKVRAAEAGMSLSDYLLAEVERVAAAMTPDEIKEQLRRLPPPDFDEPPSVTLRRIRDAS